MELHENILKPERTLLVSVDTGEFDAEASLDELEELAYTAGADVVAKISQKRDTSSDANYVGKGKLEEIKELCENEEIDLVICDSELTPSQINNLENALDVRVVDRTTLILDIFAARARTSEGKLQVQLAQLKYSLPRLTGRGKQLSRLGAGIGTRGPGETKLEVDRRHIREKIHSLEVQLDELEKRRNSLRKRRKKDGIETVALVGYTNAGKSTLMNYLTNAGVLAEDKLFATLDPTARKLVLYDGREVMLIDTVGLVRRLPHHLVEAFKSTLEEAANADLILNVCDVSSDEFGEHLNVTMNLLNSLGCENKPIISVLNKCDLLDGHTELLSFNNSVCISAKTGSGIPDLLLRIQQLLPNKRRKVSLLIPFSQGAIAGRIRKDGVVLSEDYTENGIKITAILDVGFIDEIKDYVI
ncbi:MAG: GTPase HflX [Clostridiales bacterium]|nr:GTPase HflX [Clostridia bacterium]MCR4563546.1 GTPase HflX [Clostridiales bacterium]